MIEAEDQLNLPGIMAISPKLYAKMTNSKPMKQKIALVSNDSPILFEKARWVESIKFQVEPPLKKMRKILEKRKGLGLAALQVGVGFRFFISRIRGCNVAINPKWFFWGIEKESDREGCLTWPGQHRKVSRFSSINAVWTDRKGNEHQRKLDGLEARIFQHECDHLNGVCIFEPKQKK